MRLNNLVTVIVPIYNAEKPLERCIRSILEQTYDNIEILLINDGSEDNSLNICESFSKVDSRIRVIDKENQGVSVTRNLGLVEAKGKYCCFVDSDDWIEASHVEGLLNCLKDSDIVVEGYMKECNAVIETCVFQPTTIDLKVLDVNDSIKDFFINGYIHPCWNKLFKLEIIRKNNISFETNIHISEDSLFCLKYLRYCKKLTLANLSTYHYCIEKNSNSLSKKVYMDIFEVYEKVYENICDFFRQGNADIIWGQEVLNKTIYPQLYNTVIKILRNNEQERLEKKRLLEDMRSREYCEKVFRYMYPKVTNKGERLVLSLIKEKRYRLLGVILKWIIK